MAAISKGHYKCLKLLLEYGASINTKCRMEMNAIEHAQYYGYDDCHRLLIDWKKANSRK
jgi:ankyrin repeat protein